MAITAMGIGTKQAPDNVNLDPQTQFWSWLYAFKNAQHIGTTAYRNGLFAGFSTTQNTPAGMSVLVGADTTANSAVLEYAGGKMALLSTDGTPQVVTIPTAPTSGSRIDSIVSYIDTASADPETETPGTPEYVKTVVVSGTAASSPTAPNKQQIQAALPPTVENWYHWADVRVAQGATVITNSNITDRKPTPPNLYWTTSEIQEIAQDVVDETMETNQTSVSIKYGLTCQAYRQGKMVTVSIMGGNTSTVPSDNNKVGTMPSGWRPLKDIQGPLNIMNGTGAAFSVRASGQIEINQFTGTAIPVGNYWAGSMTYITS